MARMFTHTEIINLFKEKHGGRYDYSNVIYNGIDKKVSIVCGVHGTFNQIPRHHKNGAGCPMCGTQSASKKTRKTNGDVIDSFLATHGNRYDYSKTEYINSSSKVKIICNIHGIFEQYPSDHAKGCGCPPCAYDSISVNAIKNDKDVISAFKRTHGSLYDYSLVRYTGSLKPVKIICKKHGLFEQIPKSHIKGCGCKLCGDETVSRKLVGNVDSFVNFATSIHGDKYDYSLVDYINSTTDVDIICSIHGVFSQTPSSHNKGSGCPRCGLEKVGFTKTRFRNACGGGNGTLYVIKCFNDSETFYKIGITSNTVAQRYYKNKLPYDFKVLHLHKGNPDDIYSDEKRLLRYHSSVAYRPDIDFGGATECFKEIDMNYIKKMAS